MPGRKSLDAKKPSLMIGVAAFIILVLTAWFWWHDVYMSSNNVFWSMVNNNLTSNSVTRHVIQDQTGRSVDQFIRLQFGALEASESRVTLKQTGSDGQQSIVKSETIGTAQIDYSRYVGITTPQKTSSGKPIDTSNVIGFWGKSETPKASQQSTAQYFPQSILTIIPYGNFNQKQRQDLVKQMQDQNVYDLTGGSKSEKQNGRSVFVYELKVNPAAYVQLMQTYTKDLGLGDIGLDPSSYAGSPPLSTEITVDKLSRHILKISYPSSGQSETVVDQNIFQPISLPTQTIPIAELQRRIQNLSQ